MCKETLCYPCALRMSMLFHFSPPLNYQHRHNPGAGGSTVGNTNGCPNGEDAQSKPHLDDTHHSRFIIVHETADSAWRWFRAKRRFSQSACESSPDGALSTAVDVVSVDKEMSTPRSIPWLCVACFGLYQFMDHIHAPTVAVKIRQSPFTDSNQISININVNRSLTFTWLAVATRYYNRSATMTERPSPSAIIPEEFSNFKELYMSDLRARVLQYLIHPHSEIITPKRVSIQGLPVYLKLLGVKNDSMKSKADENEERKEKVQRVEITKEEGTTCTCPQKFTYDTNNEHVVCDVYCCHQPTESLLTQADFPKHYASNKSGGMVLTYSVIYEHVMPHLQSIGWASSSLSEEGVTNVREKAREAAMMTSTITHSNIYLQGNYRKMQRNLSQSPWFVNGSRVGSFSLQEIIAGPILPFFFPEGVTALNSSTGGPNDLGELDSLPKSHKDDRPHSNDKQPHPSSVNSTMVSAEQVFGYGRYKFHSAGREDVDVRMLGSGRPFVLEIVNPSSEAVSVENLSHWVAAINRSHGGGVEVDDLRLTNSGVTLRLARHSESKLKRYRCVVWSSRAVGDPSTDPCVARVNTTTNLQIAQKTPMRVLHRRSLHARSRVIHSMRLTPLNPHWLILELETQAGTYVKEFVHGDMGRTVPNLGTLLKARTDIIQLDVMGMAIQDLDS
ncbi:unnamed protein product [Phytomonas sp. Hart1]|nr:unnamed protein product [Phytomonas sp. Hart1]|eukprot:CCW68330.1 unnamed protein product [Phytomonas sp. isolate Hart1]